MRWPWSRRPPKIPVEVQSVLLDELTKLVELVRAWTPPEPDAFDALCEEAKAKNCGMLMFMGKPGTLRIHELVPYGQIIEIDENIITLDKDGPWKTPQK